MTFVQIIDCETNRADEMQALEERWERETEGMRTARHEMVLKDRNKPDHYLMMVEFDSYEAAMRNSQLPATQKIAEEIQQLCTSPLVYIDCDVVDSHRL
jgi:quinol monooxygenase YgiN